VLMNIIRGDVARIARGEGIVKNKKFVQRIKPLQKCPESEVMFFAKLIFPKYNFSYQCPYRKDVLRADIKSMLKQLDEKHYGLLFQIYEGNKRIRESLLKTIDIKGAPNDCTNCGELTSGDICQACKLNSDIKEFLQ